MEQKPEGQTLPHVATNVDAKLDHLRRVVVLTWMDSPLSITKSTLALPFAMLKALGAEVVSVEARAELSQMGGGEVRSSPLSTGGKRTQ